VQVVMSVQAHRFDSEFVSGCKAAPVPPTDASFAPVWWDNRQQVDAWNLAVLQASSDRRRSRAPWKHQDTHQARAEERARASR
jgi:hypothetical protein